MEQVHRVIAKDSMMNERELFITCANIETTALVETIGMPYGNFECLPQAWYPFLTTLLSNQRPSDELQRSLLRDESYREHQPFERMITIFLQLHILAQFRDEDFRTMKKVLPWAATPDRIRDVSTAASHASCVHCRGRECGRDRRLRSAPAVLLVWL